MNVSTTGRDKKAVGCSDLHTQSLTKRNVKLRASLTASTCQTTDSYHTSVSLIAVCHHLYPLCSSSGVELKCTTVEKMSRWKLRSPSGKLPVPCTWWVTNERSLCSMQIHTLPLTHIVRMPTIIQTQRQPAKSSSRYVVSSPEESPP